MVLSCPGADPEGAELGATQQAGVLADVAQVFESDEGMSDSEGDRVTLFSSATQLSPRGQANAKTLTVMLQEQLDAINEEIRWVIPNSAPQKLGFSEELSSPTPAQGVGQAGPLRMGRGWEAAAGSSTRAAGPANPFPFPQSCREPMPLT